MLAMSSAATIAAAAGEMMMTASGLPKDRAASVPNRHATRLATAIRVEDERDDVERDALDASRRLVKAEDELKRVALERSTLQVREENCRSVYEAAVQNHLAKARSLALFYAAHAIGHGVSEASS